MPKPPIKVSVPKPPLRLLLAPLPVMTLLPAFPVPLIAAAPVSVRFSTFAGKVVVTEAVRVSVIVVVTVVNAPRLALVGEDKVKVKVSSASLRKSLRMVTLMTLLVT